MNFRKMNKLTRTIVFANIIGLLAVLVVNYLANSLPLNGATTGQLSDRYANLFTPTGLTFAIWGVIYLWLISWAGFQLAALFRPEIAEKVSPMLQKTGWLFAYSCLLNIGWLFAWHWEQLLVSVVIMANLLYIITQLNKAAGVGISTSNQLEKWLTHMPFGIYQGWLTVALIANVTAWLVSLGWSGIGIADLYWTIAMVAIGALLAIFLLFRQNNVGHGLAVAWALFGIYLKRINAGDGSELVAWVAISFMVAILAAIALRWKKWISY